MMRLENGGGADFYEKKIRSSGRSHFTFPENHSGLVSVVGQLEKWGKRKPVA
jgi:hypothetical protein